MCSSYLHTCREMSSHCVLGITYGSIFCFVSRRVMERTCFEPCDSHDNVQPHRVSLVTAIHDETAADGRLDVSNKPRHNTTQIAQRQQQKTPDLLKLRFSILCTWAPAPGGTSVNNPQPVDAPGARRQGHRSARPNTLSFQTCGIADNHSGARRNCATSPIQDSMGAQHIGCAWGFAEVQAVRTGTEAEPWGVAV